MVHTDWPTVAAITAAVVAIWKCTSPVKRPQEAGSGLKGFRLLALSGAISK